MKILVTGGAGYIGSIVVEELVKAGESVVVFDNLSLGHRAAVHPQAEFVKGDLLDKPAIDAVMQIYRPEAVMHFASKTLVGESMESPFLYIGDNVVAGMNLLQSCAEYGVKRFILSSTANLFDDPERIPIAETERIVPGSPYGESKFILERMLHWMDRVYGMRYAALRYFNAAGASPERGEDHTPELHIIPIVLEVALGKRQKLTIFGDDYPTIDGTCVRDYIHVLDLAQAHILALYDLDKRGSRKYNLGNGQGFSIRQLIDTAQEVTGREIPAVAGPRRAGDPATLIAASDTIKRDLGWQPKYPELRQIIQTAWDWHRTHPNGYGDR